MATWKWPQLAKLIPTQIALGLAVAAEMVAIRYMLKRGMLDIDLWLGPTVAIAYLFGFFWGALAANLMIWFAFFVRPDDAVPTMFASASVTMFCYFIASSWGPGTALATIVFGTVAYDILLNAICYPFSLDFLGRVNTVVASSFLAWLFYTKLIFSFLAF